MIIVHAKGNEEIGIGNLSRCFELIIYLSKRNEVIGIFECDEKLFERYKISNIIKSNSLAFSLKIIEKYKSVIYICDLIDANKQLSLELRKLSIKKILFFNDIKYGFEPNILFLTDGFDYPFQAKGVDVYRGFEYYIVGQNIIKNRKKNFKPITSLKNILICFGGADPAFYTEYFVKIINDNKNNYTIILGPAMNDNRKKYIKSIKKDNITYVDSPKNMVELLLSSDLLITLGGMITYEAMCLGIPACAVRWKYLEYIVKSFGEKQMVNDLGDINDAYQNMLDLNIQDLNKISENAYNIIDGSALRNIEKVIENNL